MRNSLHVWGRSGAQRSDPRESGSPTALPAGREGRVTLSITSSPGIKLLVAGSGLLLWAWIALHALGLLGVFGGASRIDGYSDWEIFWRVSLPIALPAVATTVILNFILLWNEFLYAVVLITEEANRTLPLGIQRFIGDTQEDVGMIATGLMIAIIPVVVIYAFFSERLIQGMTAGAVK